MKQSIFTIIEHTALTKDVYRMVLAGDTSAITASGQFVNILLDGFFLRRPISVCDWDDKTLTIVYKVVGHGTEAMSKMGLGTDLVLLTCNCTCRTLTRTSISLRALTANGQALSVTDASIATDFHKAFNVEGYFAAKFTFYSDVVIDIFSQFRNVRFVEIFYSRIGIDARISENLFGSGQTDTVNIGKPDFHSFFSG